jgi:hypothetical protein
VRFFSEADCFGEVDCVEAGTCSEELACQATNWPQQICTENMQINAANAAQVRIKLNQRVCGSIMSIIVRWSMQAMQVEQGECLMIRYCGQPVCDRLGSQAVEQVTIIAEPRCPRCGYELRGQVASWTEHCPIEGTCTECGLVFMWGELLNEELCRPTWCFEYPQSMSDSVNRFRSTVQMALQPWRFWRDLKMTCPVTPRRLIRYLILVLVMCYLLFAIGQGALAWNFWNQATRSLIVVPNYATISPVKLIAFAMCFPFANSTPLSPNQYWAPSGLLHSWRPAAESTLLIATSIVICPFVFTLLPVSRQRAKVRCDHIVRAGVYSTSLFLPVIFSSAGIMLLTHLNVVSTQTLQWFMLGPPGLLPFGTFLFMFIWWWAAIRHYLHMEQSVGIAVTVIVLAMLAAHVFMFTVDARYFVRMMTFFVYGIRQ